MRFWLVVVGLLLFSPSLSAQSEEMHGRVVGTVVDDDGDPVSEADVCFAKFERTWIEACQRAGSSGNFDVRIPLDTDRVYANKLEAGYLENNRLSRRGVDVHLSAVQPVAHVVLKAGPKPAHLTFNVRAKESGKPIERFLLTWLVINDATLGIRYSYSTCRNPIAVPSNRELMIFVQAQGYRRWFYLDPSNQGQPTVILQPGEEKNMDAALESSPMQD